MHPNPVLNKLGFSEKDRLVILHTDDIGMCQASVQAWMDLHQFGLISSAAVMVPCPWFPQVADLSRQNPGIDLGVHVTLNSEWDSYRWAPLSTRDPDSGLMDQDGYFHQRESAVYDRADPQAVAIEIEVQLDKALAAGIDVSHIDSHMGTVLHARFIASYIALAKRNQLPCLLPRGDQAYFEGWGFAPEVAAYIASMVLEIEESGLPLVDAIHGMPLDRPQNRLAQTKDALAALLPGITHFIIHPSVDTPELRAIAPDWPSRVADWLTFQSAELAQFIRESGIQVIGYRHLRDLVRA
jgi:hypothetical protein